MLRAHVPAGGGAVGDQPAEGQFQSGAVRRMLIANLTALAFTAPCLGTAPFSPRVGYQSGSSRPLLVVVRSSTAALPTNTPAPPT